MSKRLQVVMDDKDWRRYQRLAQGEGLTLSEWVRDKLRRIGQEHSTGGVEGKLAAIRRAARYDEAPAPDIEQMLAETERGYLGDASGQGR